MKTKKRRDVTRNRGNKLPAVGACLSTITTFKHTCMVEIKSYMVTIEILAAMM